MTFYPHQQKVESVFNEMDCASPVIYLLSAGADPTDSIEGLARKKKTDVACVSMGEVLIRAIVGTLNFLFENTSWCWGGLRQYCNKIMVEQPLLTIPDIIGESHLLRA